MTVTEAVAVNVIALLCALVVSPLLHWAVQP